jgi:ATP-dependent helicase/nuclease subunit A
LNAALPESHDTDEAVLQTIRTALGQTLFVEAGAGTGKTSALVQRIIALVLSGKAIERVAAITFTEKAAAELKDRVRQGLEDHLGKEPGADATLRLALGALDRAQISTIHSFCQDLLYLFAAEAGVDPSFEVQDEIKASRRFNDRWRAYIEALSGDSQALSVVDRALGLGMTAGDLEALARELAERAEITSLLTGSLPAVRSPDWGVLSGLRARLRGLVRPIVAESDELGRRLRFTESLIDELMADNAGREVVLASAAAVIGWNFGRCGNAGDWGAALAPARDAAANVCEGLGTLLADCRTEALRDVLPLVARFVEEDARARGRDGLMTFDDLILRVRDLLRESTGAARALRERFEVLLIDEFQDTDPLQVEIALAFAAHPETGELEPGRLFLVGDPKQSIYRFRRADMAVYSRTRAAFQNTGAGLPQLRRNRRSRPVVIDWVNHVFATLMGTGDRPALQPEYLGIRKHRDADLAGPGVACFGHEVADGSNARHVRSMESRDIAAHCRAIVEEGWEVAGRTDNSTRKAAYRDIAVLMPTRAILSALERALGDAGVPYRVEGGSLVYRTQEVRDLINCLTAIDDPADEVATVGALRSPAFACSDVDIARFVAAGGRLNYLRPGTEASAGRVADALGVIRRFHEQRKDLSLAALVESFVVDRGLVEIGILDRGDRNSFRRMRYVVEQARAFEAGGPENLRALVQWLESCSQGAILDHEGAGLDDDEDAVKVLTVHGAKGLEFPIVLLAGMGSASYSRPGSYLVDHSQETVAVQVGTKGNNRRFTIGDVARLEQLEKDHSDAEFIRLLYVAATRARDHLVFSLHRTRRASRSAAALLEGAGAREPASALGPPVESGFGTPAPFEDLRVDPPSESTADEFREQRHRLVSSSKQQAYTSATRLGRAEEQKGSSEDDSEPWSRGRGGTRLGRAVHAAVQSLPLDAREVEIEAFSRAQAVAEAIPGRSAEVARLVRAALASGAAQRAREAGRVLREVPFAVTVDGVIVEGFVDMLIETENGLEIVDWKTDQISGDEVLSRLEDYRLQAGLYVFGIEEATQCKVARVTYVFASAGREESPGDPASLARGALARVRAGGSPGSL